MCSFKLLYFVIFILNVYKTNTEISDKRLCVDPECKEPVSIAKTLVRYSSPDANILSFKPNDEAIIYSKSAGSLTTLWGAEIAGKRGYIPKDFVREIKILKVPKVLVDTELSNDSTTPKVPTEDTEPVKPDKVQQPYEVVDGTTIYLDSSNAGASTTESSSKSSLASESESEVESSANEKEESDKSNSSQENDKTVDSSVSELQNSSKLDPFSTPDILETKPDNNSEIHDSKEDASTKSSSDSLSEENKSNQESPNKEEKKSPETEKSVDKLQNPETISDDNKQIDIDDELSNESQDNEGFNIFDTISNLLAPNENDELDTNKDKNNAKGKNIEDDDDEGEDDEDDDEDDDDDEDVDVDEEDEEKLSDKANVSGEKTQSVKKDSIHNEDASSDKIGEEQGKKEEESVALNSQSQDSNLDGNVKDIAADTSKQGEPTETSEKQTETAANDAIETKSFQHQEGSSENVLQENIAIVSNETAENNSQQKGEESETSTEVKFSDIKDYNETEVQDSSSPTDGESVDKNVEEIIVDSYGSSPSDKVTKDPGSQINDTVVINDNGEIPNEEEKHLGNSFDTENAKPTLPPLPLFMDASQLAKDSNDKNEPKVDSIVKSNKQDDVTPSPFVTDLPFEIPKPLDVDPEQVTMNPLNSVKDPKEESLKSLDYTYQKLIKDAKIDVVKSDNEVSDSKQMEQQEKSEQFEAMKNQKGAGYDVLNHNHNVFDMLNQDSQETKSNLEIEGTLENEKKSKLADQKNEPTSNKMDNLQNQNHVSNENNSEVKINDLDSRNSASKSQTEEIDNSNLNSDVTTPAEEVVNTESSDNNEQHCFGILGFCIYNYGNKVDKNQEKINEQTGGAANNIFDGQDQSEPYVPRQANQNADNSDSYCDADPASSYCHPTKQDAHETHQDKNILDMELPIFTSDIFVYLVTTAVSVIFFLLGYLMIDKSRKEGPLVAKINKLEKEYLVMMKENTILREKVEGTSIDNLINTVPNAVVDELKQQLDEMAAAKAVLEEQVSSLEKELENSTEVGMELNKMLSEILSSQNGSESLMANIDQLQRQLVEQQSTINSINETLSIKDTENHELHLELDISNKKVLELQSELDKLLLNILKIEEEKELQQNTLEAQVNLYKQKYEEISASLNSREEAFNIEIQTLKSKLSETQRSLELKTKEYDVLKDTIRSAKNAKNNPEALKSLIDASVLKAELEQVKSENQNYMRRLQEQEENKFNLEKKLQSLIEDNSKLKDKYDEADKEKLEAQTKLEVLSNYFKEREAELQRELSKHESIWLEKQGEATSTIERIKYMQEELQNCKSQNEALKQEIVAQEVELKSQISVLEKKVNENWVSARQAERRLEEAKQEAAQLRNRLTMRERAINEEKAQNRMQSPMEQNGDLPLSPLHIESPASPPLLYGGRDHITKSPPLPGLPPFLPPPPPFMPPPLTGVPPFMPPPPSMFPGDHRPPPLGRMSSPPLNSRYSPDSRAYSPYDRNSPSPTYDSEYSPSSPPPIGGFSPYNSREDRRDYKRPPPQMPPHMRTNGRNAKGPTHSSGGSGNSNESLDRINQHSKV